MNKVENQADKAGKGHRSVVPCKGTRIDYARAAAALNEHWRVKRQ